MRLDAVEAEIFWWWGQCCLFRMSTLTLSLPADMRGLLSPTRGCVGAKSAPQLIICKLRCLQRRIHDPWLWRWQRILFSLYSANYIFKKSHVMMMIMPLVQLVVCCKVLLEKCSNSQKKKRCKHLSKTSICKMEIIISIHHSDVGKSECSACIRIKFIFPSSFLQKGHFRSFVLFPHTSRSKKLKLSQLLV